MIVASKSRALAAAIALGAGLLPASQAGAVSAAVRHACAGDYFAHCSSFAPDSAERDGCRERA